ncbi:type IV secretion system protein, partial [Bacillus thuringiensis]|uniref:type IV secretion system protein n=1 Tax=Bacillus thuringiensis TaxID=1428 RepID=UPI000B443418
MLEKIIDWVGGLVIHMVKALLAPIYGFMDTIPVLVFGGDKSNLDFLYAKNAVTNVLDTGMPVMFKFVAFCVLVSVVITAAKYSATTMNPNNRTALIEYAKDLMIISICLWHLDFFYNFVFDLNSWITLEFKEAINGVNNGNFNPDQQIPLLKSGLSDNKTITELSMEGHKNDYMFIIFGLFIEAGLMIWANFYYLMRAVTLYVLMLLGPVMVGMWLFPQKKQQTLYWIREFMGAVLIQAIHAITLWLVITLIGGAQNPIIKLILLAMFIPVGEIVKSFIGLSTNASGGIHRAGTMLGMGALASVAGLVKGVRDDYRSAKDKGKEKKDGEKDNKEDADNPKNALGANLGTDVGTTSRAARMLKAGQIGSSIGKAATGLAGMATGAGLGPGAMVAGSQVGSALGSAPGAVAGRSVAAVGEGAVALGKHIGSSVKKGADTYSNLNGEPYPELTDEDIAQDLATKDFENWKADNPDSAVASRLKQAFPGASDAEIAKKVAKTNSDQMSRFSNQRKQDLQNMKKTATPYGNARDLVNAATNAFQKGYEGDHKDTFMSQLPENMSAEEKEKHWNDHLNTKVQGFRNHAEQAATKAGAMPVDAKDKQGNNLFDKSYVNKDAFASRLALGKVGKAVEDVKGETLESGHQNMGQVGALVGASTAAFKKAYSADHKAGFMKQFPADMPQQEKEAAWNKHLGQKVQGFQNHAQQAAESAGIVQQKDGTNYANKEAFASHLSQQLQKDPDLNAMGISSAAGIQQAVNGVKTHGLTNGTGGQQAKQVSNVGNLVQASTESFKQGYAAENKASFMKNLSPTMYPKQKLEAWQSHLNEKGNEFKAVAQQAAVQAGAMPVQAKDTSGKSLHNQSYINKDAFASQLTKGLQSHASLGTVSQQVGSGITSAIQGVRSHGVATSSAINKAVYAATRTQASIARAGDLSVAEIERSYADASTSVANIAQSAGKMSIPTSAVGRMTQQSTKLGMSVMEGAKHLMLADRIDTVSNA